MKTTPYPSIDGAFDWYSTTKEGLRGLRAALGAGFATCESLHDVLFGMTQSEWQDYRREQESKHEIFAMLALFAACEGGIRRDFELRSSGKYHLTHVQRFRKLHKNAGGGHVSINGILTGWIGAEKKNKWLHRRLKELLELFGQRNQLAHGYVVNSVAIEPVFEKLILIREKWIQGVPDFDGF